MPLARAVARGYGLSGQELRTGSDEEGNHLIGRLERVRVFDGGPEIRTGDGVLDRKVALPSLA